MGWIKQTFSWYQSAFSLATPILYFQWLMNRRLIFFSTTPGWLWRRRGSLHGCHMWSWLITLRFHPIDLQITLRHTLYIQPHLFQHNQFSLNQHSLFHFLPNLPLILHKNLNLNLSTFCRDLPLESGRHTGLFANQVVAALLAKICSFAQRGDSSDCPSRQNWLLRPLWRLYRLQHCLCPLL